MKSHVRQQGFLVVDPSRVARKILIGMLAKIGHNTVLEAGSGREALEVLQRSAVACVLSSSSVEDMGSRELLQAVRRIFPALPYILVADSREKDLVARAVQNGLSGYLLKPVSPEAMARKIRQVFRLA